MKKVIAYIDGFNMYFGLKSKGWNHLYWLDIQKMCSYLLKENQNLIFTKYFTSKITKPVDKQNRQNKYLDALNTLYDFEIYYGRYQMNPFTCNKCDKTYNIPNEKKTDVNISTELIFDAFDDNFDVAFLFSADSDLVPTLKKIKDRFPEKNIVLMFPPNRNSEELKTVGYPYLRVGKGILTRSQFPDEIQTISGFIIRKPIEWRKSSGNK